MTDQEFVTKYHHQLWGIMLDLSRTSAHGSERSMLEGHLMKKIDSLLSAIFFDLTGAPKKEEPKPPPQKPGVAGKVG